MDIQINRQKYKQTKTIEATNTQLIFTISFVLKGHLISIYPDLMSHHDSCKWNFDKYMIDIVMTIFIFVCGHALLKSHYTIPVCQRIDNLYAMCSMYPSLNL